MMHINKVNGGDFMQKENILNDPYYQKYMIKENKKKKHKINYIKYLFTRFNSCSYFITFYIT